MLPDLGWTSKLAFLPVKAVGRIWFSTGIVSR
jgi:hypothetical protein